MTLVNPATAAGVTTALAALSASLDAGYGPGASPTHHRQLILNWFGTAVGDGRVAPGAVFDPNAVYTKLGARGVELALASYTKFLHDPANGIAMTRILTPGSEGVSYTLPSASEAAARVMIVEAVDMIIAHMVDVQYTTVWSIAVGSYEPTWTDLDDDGIPDYADIPINLVAPVLSAVARNMTVTSGSWTGTPTSYGYVWYLNGVVIAGQTTTTYSVPGVDAGDITVMVTATNAYGDSIAKQSNTLTIAAV